MNKNDVVQHVTQTVAHNKAATLGDLGSLSAIALALAEVITPIAVLFSFVWLLMRMYISYKEIRKIHKEEKDGK